MYIKEIEEKVLKLFSQYPGAQLKIKEISSILSIKKFDFTNLNDTIRKLIKDNLLIKEGQYVTSNKSSQNNESNKDSKKASNKSVSNKNSKRDYSPNSTNGNVKLIEATFDATSLAKGYSFGFAITEENDYFVSSEDLLNAYHGDKIAIEPYKQKNGKFYGVVRNVLERANHKMVGNATKYGSSYIFVCDNHKIHTSIIVTSPDKDIDNMKVEIEILNWGDKKRGTLPAGKVLSILGEAHDPEIEVLGVIKQFNLPLDFPENVIDEASMLSENISDREIERRSDFRDIVTLTIDPISAKDYDDAISLVKEDHGYSLYVHIADVGHFVKPGTELFNEAASRGNSFYFPKRVIPMLPEQISNKLCSLRPDEDKLTLSVVTKLNHKYDIIEQYAVESIINSDARLNYEEVDKFFETNELDQSDEVKELLTESLKISKRFSEKLKKNGYINFRLPDVEYIYDEEGHLVSIIESEETASHKLVENFMLLANEYVATYLKEKTKTTIYRVHELPDKEKIENVAKLLSFYGHKMKFDGTLNHSIQEVLKSFEGTFEEKVFNKMILRSMKKAQYTTKHNLHFGLSIQNYTHFTSPIRRLSDLVIHLQLKSLLGKDGFTFKAKSLEELAENATQQEVLSDEAYRAILKKMVEYFMKDRIGKEYEALITGMNNSNMFVTLLKYPITGVVKLSSIPGDYFVVDEEKMMITGKKKKKQFKLAQKIDIRVSDVTDDIYFDIIL
ncbi:VacB/RNase II family 3'-5' exoribonuclease [bacterium]|nr:VacB/RNase II family 3'-5' exoribonuclease [bacterium]